MTPITTDSLVVEISQTLENAATIVSAFDHVGAVPRNGFTLAAACAMVELESGGRMVWGADPWNARLYPHGAALPDALHEAPVTEANYHTYKARRNQGMQPQGCGITQLTSPGLQVEAERAGGCWEPFYNCVVGFHDLQGLFARWGGALGGFTAYNGSGPAAEAYAQRALNLEADWQRRFDALR